MFKRLVASVLAFALICPFLIPVASAQNRPRIKGAAPSNNAPSLQESNFNVASFSFYLGLTFNADGSGVFDNGSGLSRIVHPPPCELTPNPNALPSLRKQTYNKVTDAACIAGLKADFPDVQALNRNLPTTGLGITVERKDNNLTVRVPNIKRAIPDLARTGRETVPIIIVVTLPTIDSYNVEKDAIRRGRSVAWVYFSPDVPDIVVNGNLSLSAKTEDTEGEDITPQEIADGIATLIMKVAGRNWNSEAAILIALLALIPAARGMGGMASIAGRSRWAIRAPGISRPVPRATRRMPNTPSAKTIKNSPPKIDTGQQGKHLPNSRNYDPKRSSLTADPNKLAEKAGTGTPVNKTPRGQAGFRERVDFGETIGDYVDEKTGVRMPTTKGIIHYSKTGIHIVPARP